MMRGAVPSNLLGGNPMSKKLVPLAALSFLLVVACTPRPAVPIPPDPAAENAKLRSESMVWFDLYANGDGPGMGSLYAEDAVLMPPGTGAVTGRAAIAKFLGDEAAGAKAAGVAIKNREVTGSGVSGDTGWISGTYDVVDASGKVVDSGNYLSVHQRINGQWLYIRDTWNSDRPVTPTTPAAPSAGVPPSN